MNKDLTALHTNYIYWKRKNWEKNKVAFGAAAFNANDIWQAYQANANAMDSALSKKKLPDNFVEEITKLLEFSKQSDQKITNQLDTQLGDSFFSDIAQYVSNKMVKTDLGNGLTLGNINVKLKDFQLNAQNFTNIMNGFNLIQNEIAKFDSGFVQLQKAILPNSTVGFLSADGMSKTEVAYSALKNFLKKYSTHAFPTTVQGVNQLRAEILRLVGLVTGDLKGGLYQYADYIHTQSIAALATSIRNVANNSGGRIKISGGFLSGTNINKNEKGQNFVAKSDNVIITVVTNKDNLDVTINLGISDKSYREGRAGGKSIAQGVNWPSVMDAATQAGMPTLTETAFEYYYANLIYFNDPQIYKAKESLVNSFLAAKASSFLIAGIASGSVQQAYFVRYGDSLVYIPQLLKTIAKNKRGGFGITPTMKKKTQNFIQTPLDEITDAYARVHNSINKLRTEIAFNAIR